jgi:HSP20 family protein
MFDPAWLEGALELQKKFKELADRSWHFDKSWLEKAMEIQKMTGVPAIDPNWYQEMLDQAMKWHPGTGIFERQESGARPADDAGAAQEPPAFKQQPRDWQPQFTISETPGQVTLSAYIPGIRSREDLTIQLHGSTLYISGNNQGPFAGQGRGGQVESFSRELRLPADVRGEGTRAYYANGLLTIKIPKATTTPVDIDFSR